MSVTIAMPRMSTDPELTTAQSKYVESLARAGAEVHWVELSDPDAARPLRNEAGLRAFGHESAGDRHARRQRAAEFVLTLSGRFASSSPEGRAS